MIKKITSIEIIDHQCWGVIFVKELHNLIRPTH